MYSYNKNELCTIDRTGWTRKKKKNNGAKKNI